MEECLEILQHIQHEIGGGIIFLECENKEPLLKFYSKFGFIKYGERKADNDIHYQLLLKAF